MSVLYDVEMSTMDVHKKTDGGNSVPLNDALSDDDTDVITKTDKKILKNVTLHNFKIKSKSADYTSSEEANGHKSKAPDQDVMDRIAKNGDNEYKNGDGNKSVTVDMFAEEVKTQARDQVSPSGILEKISSLDTGDLGDLVEIQREALQDELDDILSTPSTRDQVTDKNRAPSTRL